MNKKISTVTRIRKSFVIKGVMGLALIYFNHQECWAMLQRKYLGDSHAGSSLPPADTAQPGLVLDDAVGHPHLTAQSWQEHHHL